MARAPRPIGGFDCEFVDPIPESLTCPVCLLAFRDPHLLDCCGAKYCAECIGRVKKSGRPLCPICKQKFKTMLDKNDQRKVLGLKVRCSRKSNGCQWEGELRHLNEHEGVGCEWRVVAGTNEAHAVEVYELKRKSLNRQPSDEDSDEDDEESDEDQDSDEESDDYDEYDEECDEYDEDCDEYDEDSDDDDDDDDEDSDDDDEDSDGEDDDEEEF